MSCKRTCWWTSNETARRRLPVYQRHQRPDCQSKTTWNQGYVLARHQLWRFSGKLYKRRISRLQVNMKFTIFPRNLSCQKLILLVKISWLIFSAVSGVEIENSQRKLTFLSRATRAFAPTWACLQSNRRLTPRSTLSSTEATTDDQCSVNPS